jgi:hypothetical protein
LENFTNRSDGQEILGLGILQIGITQTDTSDETIVQQNLVEDG